MNADAAVNLVVQPDLVVARVAVAGELHPVHAQVGMAPAGPLGVLRVHLRQGDERSAVARPTLQGWQVADFAFVAKDGAVADEARPQVPERARDVGVAPRPFPE